MPRARTPPSAKQLAKEINAALDITSSRARSSTSAPTTTTPPETAPMTRQPATSVALVAATIAATARKPADPRVFDVAGSAKGIAGILVIFGAPSLKPSPSSMRNAFSDALDRALSSTVAPDDAAKFLASLPDVVTPVAALGIAVRDAVETGARWVHNRTAEKSSRWTYCAAHVTADSVSIHGDGTCAEALSDGTLTIDAGVPADVARTLRTAYEAARGVVEVTRVAALVGAHIVKAGGRSVGPAAYLLPAMTNVTCGVLAGLTDLGGWSVAYPVADRAQIAALATPIVQSIEEQIATTVRNVQDFVERAKAAAQPDGPAIQKRSGETVRNEIAAVRASAALWRDRLNLAALDVDDVCSKLETDADAADRAALAAVNKRRADKALAKEVATLTGGAQ